MKPWLDIAGDPAGGLLLIADHASNRVPDGIALGVPAAVMDEHVAIDIGVAPLARALCARLTMPGILGDVSRLVVDLNRERDSPGLIPVASDGHAIPGNAALGPDEQADRVARYWAPYHRHVARTIASARPTLLISLHSFTPSLREGGAPRPWEVGVLYNRDDRAARVAIPLLAAAAIVTGDNRPYSGKVLNATMNRHAEGNAIPYLGLEIRQDLIAGPTGVTAWCDRLATIVAATAAAFAPSA